MTHALSGRSVLATTGLTTLLASLACNSASKTADSASPQSTKDPRTPVVLSIDGQQAVLREMRQMLAAIGGALSATARGDTAAALAALDPAGSAAAADPALEASLPATWKELAERTHGGFDSLTAAVRRARTAAEVKDTVLVGVARVSASCTACHETFRLVIR
jgi:cytochrome c556